MCAEIAPRKLTASLEPRGDLFANAWMLRCCACFLARLFPPNGVGPSFFILIAEVEMREVLYGKFMVVVLGIQAT